MVILGEEQEMSKAKDILNKVGEAGEKDLPTITDFNKWGKALKSMKATPGQVTKLGELTDVLLDLFKEVGGSTHNK